MPKSERMKTIYAVVVGSGRFPIDMLRYDRCFPYREEDTNTIQNSREERPVVIERRAPNPMFTPERWESFGWTLRLFMEVSEAVDFARNRKAYLKAEGVTNEAD